MDLLGTLLEKLQSDDQLAAERAFVAYEPYLRRLVRRHIPPALQSKFDSCDIVQSVWAGLLGNPDNRSRRFNNPAHLRAFLVKVTRNRFIDGWRKHRAALEQEQSLDQTSPRYIPAAPDPRPSEWAQAEELWQRMLSVCPPAYHEILRLRRAGLTLMEIAERTGLHEGSIRRIIRKVSRQVATQEPSTRPIP
jgi:RNA polymerase sigma-70 factor (ECF subfamily)